MKIKVDIDCTPQEARSFFGLPDLTPVHDTVVAAMQERMKAALDSTDAEALLKAWMPQGLDMAGQMGAQSLEAMQKFWSGAMGAAAGADKSKG